MRSPRAAGIGGVIIAVAGIAISVAATRNPQMIPSGVVPYLFWGGIGAVVAGLLVFAYAVIPGRPESPKSRKPHKVLAGVYTKLATRGLATDERTERLRDLLREAAREGHERYVAAGTETLPDDMVWLTLVHNLLRRTMVDGTVLDEFEAAKADAIDRGSPELWTQVANFLEKLAGRLERRMIRSEAAIPSTLGEVDW